MTLPGPRRVSTDDSHGQRRVSTDNPPMACAASSGLLPLPTLPPEVNHLG